MNPMQIRTGRPPTLARNGMIATPHYLATEAGNHVLQQGGSAVDAAIAANAVLCVVYPHMAGLGGDCFWLLWDAGERRLAALNGSGRSARAATIDFYRDQGYDEIPERGPLSANTVPGTVDGWSEAHRRLGRLDWGRLFERSIRYAGDGVPVPRSTAVWFRKDHDILATQEVASRTFLPNGRAPALGEVFVQPDLARSLRQVADGGREAFYEGPIAREITRYLEEIGGLLSMDDFTAHRSDWVDPIRVPYRGVEVCTFPPNTQGVALLLILNMLEGADVSALGDGSTDYVHTIVEYTKLAFADRDRWVTDPEFLQAPMDRLLARDYADQRRRTINAGRASSGDRIRPGLAAGEAAAGERKPVAADTIYLCAVDADGNAASLIQSIYHDFGSAIVGGATGIILQNRGSYFSLDPDHVNRLEPGKRTFHTLMPSMVLRDGRPMLVLGTMGGEGQPQTQTALITRIVDFGNDPQEAVEAPRWLYGRAWGEEETTLKLEGRFPGGVADELRQRGHEVEVVDDWDEVMGHAQAIAIDPDSGVLAGAADPRGDGAAMGW